MKTAVIYLASGNSKRFGYENKLLKNISTFVYDFPAESTSTTELALL